MEFDLWNKLGIITKMNGFLEEVKRHKPDLTSLSLFLSETKQKGECIQKLQKYIHVYSYVKYEENAKKSKYRISYRKIVETYQAGSNK